MDVVVLCTERCELSPPTDADVDEIFEACQDPAIQRYTTVPTPCLRRISASTPSSSSLACSATGPREERRRGASVTTGASLA